MRYDFVGKTIKYKTPKKAAEFCLKNGFQTNPKDKLIFGLTYTMNNPNWLGLYLVKEVDGLIEVYPLVEK